MVQFKRTIRKRDYPIGANKQQSWDDIASEDTFQQLLSQSNQIHHAGLLAAKQPHSGCWLRAVPIPQFGLHPDDETFRIAVALRLAASICEPHSCRCGARVDRLGHQGLTCCYSEGSLPIHANIMTW